MAGLVTRGAQLLLRTRLGAPVGRAGYVFAARAVTRALLRVPGVDAVYLTGSLSRPGSAQPGYSDIDLALLVTARTVAEELALRDGVARVQRIANTVGPLFKNIDYIESRDADLYRRFGNAWAVDLDRRWKRLGGKELILPERTHPPRHAKLQKFAWCLRRWFKASSWLLDPNDQRERFIVERGLRRLLADNLATLVEADRLDPLPTLLAKVPEGLQGPLATLRHMAGEGTLAHEPVLLMAAALQALESSAAILTHGWLSVPLPEVPCRTPDAELARIWALARGSGVSSACLGKRSSGDFALVVVSGPESDHVDIVSRHRELLRRSGELARARFPWARRPVLITPTLFAAGSLFEPPFACAEDVIEVHGDALPNVRVPSVEDRAALDRALRLSRIVKARGRRFRAARTRAEARQALAFEVHRLDLDVDPGATEGEILGSLRGALDQERRRG